MNKMFPKLNLKDMFVSCSVTCLLFISALPVFSVAQMAKGESKFLGNVIGYSTPSEWTQYWNQVSPENAGKWESVQRNNKDQFNWEPLKKQYEFAKTNGFPFKQHTFVWGSQDPGWMKGNQLSNAEKKAACLNWMTQFAKEFPDVDMIDVVNEPINQPPVWKDALGGDGSTGWDWVIWSFEQARKLFPKAKLLINEYGIINDPQKMDKYLGIIKHLQDKNLIDGIGIQAHCFNIDNLSASNLKNNLDKLAKAGLPIYPSELDIRGDDQTQLERYKRLFPIFWEHKSVPGITIWGYRQGECWKEDTWLRSSSGQERPALKWLNEYVSGDNRTYKLTAIGSGKGTVTKEPSKDDYPKDTKVKVTAAPAEGWKFTGWTGDITSSEAILDITMNATQTITANFIRNDGAKDLVTNGDFSGGADPWTFNNWGGVGTGSVVDGEYRLTVQTTSDKYYNIQVVQPGIKLEKGKSYTLSFDAYASADRDLYINIGQAVSPWQTYLGDANGVVKLTTTKKTYALDITMGFSSDPEARVEFSAALQTPSVFIDNVSMMEKSTTSMRRQFKVIEKQSILIEPAGRSSLNITFNTFNSGTALLQFFDLKGQIIHSEKINTTTGLRFTYTLNRTVLPNGSYIVKVLNDGPIQQTTMILSR